MGEKERMDDAGYAHEVLKGLPGIAVPASLGMRILADFDRVSATRGSRLTPFLARFGERLWPGAPAWQPASVLAISLVVGLMAGAFIPSPTASNPASEQVVAALDTTPEMDLDRDQ